VIRVLAAPAWKGREVQPYPALLADAMVAAGAEVHQMSARRLWRERHDVVHVHWPEYVLRQPSRLRLARQVPVMLGGFAAARRRGARLVWTVHNLDAHEQDVSERIERRYWARFLGLVDGIVSLSHAAVPLIHERHPVLRDRPVSVVPHGHYVGAYPDHGDDALARRRAGIPPDVPCVGFVGQIRPYKDVPALVAAHRALGPGPERLLVAGGASDPALEAELRRAAGADERVVLRLGFVHGPELQDVLRAMDLVVLPYREVLNSGSVILALGFGRRVLVPASPVFDELAATVGEDWIRRYEPPLSAATLRAALDAPRPPAPPDLGPLDWGPLGRRTVEFYTSLLASRRATRRRQTSRRRTT
jgi:beta-1,4-mannosyltransferase